MRTKSNKNIRLEKDDKKSYVYLYDGNKQIGMLNWHYTKKKWMYDDWQKVKDDHTTRKI